MNRNIKLNQLIKVALLGAIAYVLMFLEFRVPFMPEFLKVDISDLPAVIAAFAIGPIAGAGVELIKNMLHLMQTSTGGVGELANFLVGAAIVVTAGWYYKRNHSFKGAVIGLSLGVLMMALVGALANYFILLPFYAKIMPFEVIIDMSAAVNGSIVDKMTLVLYAIIPFNLMKGVAVSLLTLLIYKRVSPLLNTK